MNDDRFAPCRMRHRPVVGSGTHSSQPFEQRYRPSTLDC
jgi:hypothetical protein